MTAVSDGDGSLFRIHTWHGEHKLTIACSQTCEVTFEGNNMIFNSKRDWHHGWIILLLIIEDMGAGESIE